MLLFTSIQIPTLHTLCWQGCLTVRGWRVNQNYDTCIQASPEIDVERRKSQDLGDTNRTHNHPHLSPDLACMHVLDR